MSTVVSERAVIDALDRERKRLEGYEWAGYGSVLSQLIVVPERHRQVELAWVAKYGDPEMLDATWEDENGRLPHEPGYVGSAPVLNGGPKPPVELPPAPEERPAASRMEALLAEVSERRDELLVQAKDDQQRQAAISRARMRYRAGWEAEREQELLEQRQAEQAERRRQRAAESAQERRKRRAADRRAMLDARGIPPEPMPLRGKKAKTKVSLAAMRRAWELYYFDELNLVETAHRLVEEGLSDAHPMGLAGTLGRQWQHRGWPHYPRKRHRRQVVPRKDKGRLKYLSEANLLEAKRLYDEEQLSIRQVAERILDDTGYVTCRGTRDQLLVRCKTALFNAFRDRGWQLRAQGEVTAQRNYRHGRHPGPGATGKALRDYREFVAREKGWKAQRSPGNPTCIGVKSQYPNKGKPCERPAQDGSEYCYGHNPATQAQRTANMVRMRARKAKRVELDARPFIDWLREGREREGEMFFTRIGMDRSMAHRACAGMGSNREQLLTVSPQRVIKYAGEDGYRRLYPDSNEGSPHGQAVERGAAQAC